MQYIQNDKSIINEMYTNLNSQKNTVVNNSKKQSEPKITGDTEKAEDEKKLEENVNKANKIVESFAIGFEFNYNEEASRFQVSIINKETGEVLKSIPSDEMIKIAENLQTAISGIISHYQ